jgi:hypothetical protein
MPEKRLSGWVIAVQAPQGAVRLYATVTDTLDHATALVGDHLRVTNEKVEFERVLTDGEVTRLGLKSGEVKAYA